MHITSQSGATGIVLGEIYETTIYLPSPILPNPPVFNPTGFLANLSCRARVGSGDNTFIMGFVIRDNPKDVFIRAVGPSLAQFGLNNGIPDPHLVIYNSAGKVVVSTSGPYIPVSGWFNGGAFPITSGSNDAAVFISLPVGAYTVHITSQSGATGIAMGELYEAERPPEF